MVFGIKVFYRDRDLYPDEEWSKDEFFKDRADAEKRCLELNSLMGKYDAEMGWTYQVQKLKVK